MDHRNVAYLNNNAVALFQTGYHSEAVSSLRAAINQLRGRVTHEPTHSNSYSSLGSPCSSNKHVAEPSLDRITRVTTIEQASEYPYPEVLFFVPVEQPTDTGCQTYITSSMYQCAIILAETSVNFSSEYYAMASVAVLYNLAFVHHWRAVHLCITPGLSKAMQAYSMALKIIPRKNCHPDTGNVALAIWNNLGHINSQLFQVREARACYVHLRYLLLQQGDRHCWLSKQDYEVFLLSAMFQGSELHLAPAA